jgi:hypothetical protein
VPERVIPIERNQVEPRSIHAAYITGSPGRQS